MEISNRVQAVTESRPVFGFDSEAYGKHVTPSVGNDLQTQFLQYFDILEAESSALKVETYRIRYQVYCREVCLHGFNPENYPGGLEFDAFDEQAVHCVLRHRPTGLLAGTVRIVLNQPGHAFQYFPVESVAGRFIRQQCVEARGIPRAAVGEISRFILASKFRSRRGESHWPDGMPLLPLDSHYSEDRRSVLHPMLGLVRAALEVSAALGLSYWYAGMEPRLERRLRQLGLMLEPISPIIDYHGACRAYLTHVPTMLRRVRASNFDVWTLVTDAGRIRFFDDTKSCDNLTHA